MPDLNDLARPVTTDTEPNVLDTLRAHVVRAATWSGWGSTANKVAGIMSAVTAAVSGGRSLRLYRRNDANTADEEVISLPGVSIGGNAATASSAQAGSALQSVLNGKAALSSPVFSGTPTVPTATAGSNTLQVANTAFVSAAVANVVSSSPAALDTLSELASALGNDSNFAATTATALGNRVVRTSANRQGVTRLYRRDDDSDYSVQTNWTGSRWRVRGYSGDAFHAEAEVAYADVAGSAAAAATKSFGNRTTAIATTEFVQSAMDAPSNRGFRNRIINGNPLINQRGYVSGSATAVGQYTLDRWKVSSTGGVTFSTTANKTTVTIPAGQTLQQVVEGLNLETGTYVLSWEGTAQGRIGAGAYGNSGAVTASVTGGTNTAVEFNAGTLANVQLEPGTVATPFERRDYGRELMMCQRYFCSGEATGYDANLMQNPYLKVTYPVWMRSAPLITRTGNGNITADTAGTSAGSIGVDGFYFFKAGSTVSVGGSYTASSEL